ncbi:CST complex subunit STN1 [Entomortierella beljakovae]|nr:CST complex subunit STN1 [Entomortierella beljakovae]
MDTPVILWGLDPLLHVPLQLMIFQVKTLQPVPDQDGVYCHHSHKIRTVEIMGVVQQVYRGSKFTSYNLDDGTGAIRCMMWFPDNYRDTQNTDVKEFELGQLVRIVGQPSEYKGFLQVVFQPGDIYPNDETIFRLRVLNKERSVYSKPVILPDIVLSGIDLNQKIVSSTIMPCEKKSYPSDVSKTALLDATRSWVSRQNEFSYLDFEDDDEINKLARDIVQAYTPGIHPGRERLQASELMNECIQQLLSEGIIEFKSLEKMILRVIKSRNDKPEVIDLDPDENMEEIIVMDDSE